MSSSVDLARLVGDFNEDPGVAHGLKDFVSRTQCNTTKEQVFKNKCWSAPATSRLYYPAILGGCFKYFAFSPRKLGIHEPFLLAHIFKWVGSTQPPTSVSVW